MNFTRWLLGRTQVSRRDVRDAMTGLLGGVLVAITFSVAASLPSMDVPYYAGESQKKSPETFASHIDGLSWVGAAVWSEVWVPSEWRAWARPGADLSWPPEVPWECPPGAYCCPDPPETICRPELDRWRSSTPQCPFEPAPLAELPWATSNYRGPTLDSTGQPIWLGCEVREGAWRIVQIGLGLDGDPLTEDDEVRVCLGPELGWPREHLGGWPVEEGRPVARADAGRETNGPNGSGRGSVTKGSQPLSSSPR